MKMSTKEQGLYDNVIEMLNGKVVARAWVDEILQLATALNIVTNAIKTRMELERSTTKKKARHNHGKDKA